MGVVGLYRHLGTAQIPRGGRLSTGGQDNGTQEAVSVGVTCARVARASVCVWDSVTVCAGMCVSYSCVCEDMIMYVSMCM